MDEYINLPSSVALLFIVENPGNGPLIGYEPEEIRLHSWIEGTIHAGWDMDWWQFDYATRDVLISSELDMEIAHN